MNFVLCLTMLNMIWSDQMTKMVTLSVYESFHVIRPNLLKVRARTDPDLPILVIFCYKKMKENRDGARTATQTLDTE